MSEEPILPALVIKLFFVGATLVWMVTVFVNNIPTRVQIPFLALFLTLLLLYLKK